MNVGATIALAAALARESLAPSAGAITFGRPRLIAGHATLAAESSWLTETRACWSAWMTLTRSALSRPIRRASRCEAWVLPQLQSTTLTRASTTTEVTGLLTRTDDRLCWPWLVEIGTSDARLLGCWGFVNVG
jgi:hypothetical protein